MQARIHPPHLWQYRPLDAQDVGFSKCTGWLSCCDSFFMCWCEEIFLWPLAHCIAGWLPKRIVIGFWIVMLTMIVIFRSRAEIIIKILVVDQSSTSPTAGRKCRMRKSAAPLCHDVKGWQVPHKYDKIKRVTNRNVNECIVNELQHCVKERKRWYD